MPPSATRIYGGTTLCSIRAAALQPLNGPDPNSTCSAAASVQPASNFCCSPVSAGTCRSYQHDWRERTWGQCTAGMMSLLSLCHHPCPRCTFLCMLLQRYIMPASIAGLSRGGGGRSGCACQCCCRTLRQHPASCCTWTCCAFITGMIGSADMLQQPPTFCGVAACVR